MIFFHLFWQDAAAAIDNMVGTLFGDEWLCCLPSSEAPHGMGYTKSSLVLPYGELGGTVIFIPFGGLCCAFLLGRTSLSSLAGQFG